MSRRGREATKLFLKYPRSGHGKSSFYNVSRGRTRFFEGSVTNNTTSVKWVNQKREEE